MTTNEMFGKEYIVKVTDDGECITVGELIRCKDCKYYEDDIGDCIGFGDGHYVAEEEYCSRARRKEE